MTSKSPSLTLHEDKPYQDEQNTFLGPGPIFVQLYENNLSVSKTVPWRQRSNPMSPQQHIPSQQHGNHNRETSSLHARQKEVG